MGLLRLCCGFWSGIDGSSVMQHSRSSSDELEMHEGQMVSTLKVGWIFYRNSRCLMCSRREAAFDSRLEEGQQGDCDGIFLVCLHDHR